MLQYNRILLHNPDWTAQTTEVSQLHIFENIDVQVVMKYWFVIRKHMLLSVLPHILLAPPGALVVIAFLITPASSSNIFS